MASSHLNLPNSITIARILAAPVFLGIIFSAPDKHEPFRWVALLIFVAAIATDGVDGAIARSRGLVTDLGKLLDPIADKVLIGAGLFALSLLGEVPWWITLVILFREIGITVYRMIALKDRVIAANAGGKAKTIMQGIVISLLISPLDMYWALLGTIEQIALYLTVIVTVVTGVQYLWVAFRSERSND